MLTRRPVRLLALTAALLLVGALGPLLTAVPAGAAGRADPGANCPPGQDDCNVWDDDPPTPGNPGNPGEPGDGDDGGGGPAARCQWEGRVIPCYDEFLGYFDNSTGCYHKLLEPQPTIVEGKQWYLVTCNGGLGSSREELFDAPPPGFGAPPDPEELARRALASITLKAPRISVAPRRGTGPGLVGLPVWMWASPGANYFGPLTASASDRGLTVTITARVDRIVWDMGNGDRVTCTGPGTPYRVDGPYAGQPSPDCGYDDGYARAGSYRISATTFWTVEWSASSGGAGDSFSLNRNSGGAPIEIDELQVVTR
ncbi:hypothetical protein ACN28G_27430 [Micromonospora sp. WMMA1923]|uniref:hypothetical protein n=1 Tax=Micromonospora sp. WMMA1923 TaxID=3404125 RepID=UPI003B93DA87